MTKKILVIGSGSWGTALGNHIANNNFSVDILSRNQETIDEINNHNTNQKYLSNIRLSKNLIAIGKINSSYDLIFIAVPSNSMNQVIRNIDKKLLDQNTIFIICSKGIDQESLKFFGELFKDNFTNDYAILSGPNFASEVAEKKPTITTLACNDQFIFQKISLVLDNNFFKSFYSNAIGCVEVCGVMKNIMAIGCAMIDQLQLGVNAKSALVNKGINEIRLLCNNFKFQEDLNSPAGFGDIFLTCSSTKSRNYSLGIIIVKQQPIPNNITYEGLNSLKLMIAIAKKHDLQLDLCDVIFKIITNKYNPESIQKILTDSILS